MTYTTMPSTGQRRTRSSNARREALLSVCHTLRTDAIQKSARAMAQAYEKTQAASEPAQSAHWQAESARWEAEAAAAQAREAATSQLVTELSQQNRALARKLSQAHCDIAHLRSMMALHAPQGVPPQVGGPLSGFHMPPRLKLTDSQPRP